MVYVYIKGIINTAMIAYLCSYGLLLTDGQLSGVLFYKQIPVLVIYAVSYTTLNIQYTLYNSIMYT